MQTISIMPSFVLYLIGDFIQCHVCVRASALYTVSNLCLTMLKFQMSCHAAVEIASCPPLSPLHFIG